MDLLSEKERNLILSFKEQALETDQGTFQQIELQRYSQAIQGGDEKPKKQSILKLSNRSISCSSKRDLEKFKCEQTISTKRDQDNIPLDLIQYYLPHTYKQKIIGLQENKEESAKKIFSYKNQSFSQSRPKEVLDSNCQNVIVSKKRDNKVSNDKQNQFKSPIHWLRSEKNNLFGRNKTNKNDINESQNRFSYPKNTNSKSSSQKNMIKQPFQEANQNIIRIKATQKFMRPCQSSTFVNKSLCSNCSKNVQNLNMQIKKKQQINSSTKQEVLSLFLSLLYFQRNLEKFSMQKDNKVNYRLLDTIKEHMLQCSCYKKALAVLLECLNSSQCSLLKTK